MKFFRKTNIKVMTILAESMERDIAKAKPGPQKDQLEAMLRELKKQIKENS